MLVSKKKFNERLEHTLGKMRFYKSYEGEPLTLIKIKGESFKLYGKFSYNL